MGKRFELAAHTQGMLARAMSNNVVDGLAENVKGALGRVVLMRKCG